MAKRNTTDTIVIHCTQTPPGMDVDVDKVLNRIELQQSDFLTRALKQTDSKGHIERLRGIREIIESKNMYRN